MTTTAVKDLVESARLAFVGKGDRFGPEDVAGVRRALDRVTVEDVGLAREAAQAKRRPLNLGGLFGGGARRRRPVITYRHIYECPAFSVGIFCIPEHASIPTHDHPGMTVCSKVLFGAVRVTAFDPLEEGGDDRPRPLRFAARRVTDAIASASSGSFALFPNSGNIHTFEAVESCAILDVLAPPYDASEGRDCTYYTCLQADSLGNHGAEGREGAGGREGEGEGEREGEGEGALFLEAIEAPDDFTVEGVAYCGDPAVWD